MVRETVTASSVRARSVQARVKVSGQGSRIRWRAARALGCSVTEVLPSSTGVIGVEMNASLVTDAMPALVDGLRAEGVRYFGFLYAGLMIAADGTPERALRLEATRAACFDLAIPIRAAILPTCSSPSPR